MTSIADDGEFRFARFYIVCEAVLLGTLGNPLIVCGLSDAFRGLSKRGRNTESDAKIQQEEMHAFFQRMFHLHFHLKSVGCVSYPIACHVKRDCLLQATAPFLLAVSIKLFVQQIVVLDGRVDRVRHFLHCLLRCLLVI